jgi:hypothetical protein
MTPERWKQIEQLLHSVLECEEGQRTAFLDRACVGDEALRQEVETLLKNEGEARSFLELPGLETTAKGIAADSSQPTVVTGSEWSSPSMIGHTVSHYRILEKLGEGGMGVVYKAVDLRLERLVALKFLPPHLSPDEEEMTRFVREAKTASALDHPNIGTIHEIAETGGGQLFIVMAYYEGETLKQKIERGPLPIKEVVDIAVQMTQGLAKAHSLGIVHRDIKPGNLLLTKDGLVKIIDFGLAKLGGLTKITKSHTTMGTVAYMSPEQTRGEEVDERTDVWSLGVVLYEMLSGQLPFPGKHREAIFHAILTAKPKPLKQLRADVPAQIEQIVHQSLEKELKPRYRSATEVLQDLNDYQSTLITPEIRMGGWALFSAWVKQKQVAIPALLFLLLIGLLLGWYFHRAAKVRWAIEQALPEVRHLIDGQRYPAAFTVAQKAAQYIPTDPKLAKLWSEMSSVISIQTTPPGANIYMKEYNAVQGSWTYLGQSPLAKVRLPWGGLRLKVEKRGFVTVETVEDLNWTAFVFGVNTLSLFLDEEESVPPGMVRLSAWTSPFSPFIPGWEQIEPVQLPDYLMDRFEVTNKQFKRFVDSGGYQKSAYWKEPFLKGGHVISWGQAMMEFHDATGRPGPSTWAAGDYPAGQDDYPVSGVSWYEAAAYAEYVGKTLPTIYHWNNAAMTLLSPYIVPLSNFSGQGPDRAGSHQGMSRSGAYDMAGNVKEWCWNEGGQGKRYILGGGWDEPVYMFNEADAQSPFQRYANFGFRCMKCSLKDAISRATTKPIISPARNYEAEHPVSPEIFQVYKSLYSYDKTPLNSKVESRDERDENWKKEKVTFGAAYGKERVIAYLFLPEKFIPPYQTLFYFPSSECITNPGNDLNMIVIDFVIKSGRAVFYPVLKGTSERKDELKWDYPDLTSLYRDHVICWSKDLARSIDYLETRPDIDHDKIGYYGLSWGGPMGAIMPALENRLKVSVLIGGGFYLQRTRPEVDQINFAPRVSIPTLMLNGRYDFGYPVETSQLPMFRLLGTPTEHKRHIIFESGHVAPRNQLIKETLDWLDRYLGPVTRKDH